MFSTSLRFNPAPPPAGKTFYCLRVQLTDAGGTVHTKNFMPGELAALPANPDGSRDVLVSFSTPVAVGAYTIVGRALDMSEQLIGAEITHTGTVSLADGAWYAAPVAFV